MTHYLYDVDIFDGLANKKFDFDFDRKKLSNICKKVISEIDF